MPSHAPTPYLYVFWFVSGIIRTCAVGVVWLYVRVAVRTKNIVRVHYQNWLLKQKYYMFTCFTYYTFIDSSHYSDVIMSTIASQIISPTIVYAIVYSDADQWKHQSSASLAFVWGIHRWPVNSPHKRPVSRKIFPFDDVIVHTGILTGPYSQRLTNSCLATPFGD